MCIHGCDKSKKVAHRVKKNQKKPRTNSDRPDAMVELVEKMVLEDRPVTVERQDSNVLPLDPVDQCLPSFTII